MQDANQATSNRMTEAEARKRLGFLGYTDSDARVIPYARGLRAI